MAPLSADVLVVFAIVAAAVALFVTEAIPTDTTAIAVLVSLVVFRGFTHVSPEEAISGFASPATITILAMYVLSAGVEATGAVNRLEGVVARFTHGDRDRLLAASVTAASGALPAIVTLALFYVLTGLLANLITPVASVALVLPIAVSTANAIGAEAFGFVLAVTFAASTAFMTHLSNSCWQWSRPSASRPSGACDRVVRNDYSASRKLGVSSAAETDDLGRHGEIELRTTL